MIVSCENCGAKYKLDPARVTGRGVRITCPRCKNVFAVYNHGDAPPEDPGHVESVRAPALAAPAAVAAPPDPLPAVAPPPPAAAAPARPDVSTLDFPSVGIQAWKVKVAIGLVYDFSDYKTLARYIKDGRVGDADQISHDGKSWTVLRDIPDLPEHFHQVYLAARDRLSKGAPARAGGGEFDDESPTMIVGASTLAGTLGTTTLGADPGGGSDDMLALSAALAAAADDADSVPEQAAAADAVGPRFEDPFAKARARTAATTGGKRKGGAPSNGGGPPPGAETAAPGQRNLVVVVAAGALVGALAVGAWSVWSNQRDAQDALAVQAPDPQDQLIQERQKEIAEAAAVKTINQVQEDLKAAAETEALDPTAFEVVDDDVAVPVGPSGRSSGGGSASAAMAGVGNGTMSVSASPTTAADHYDAGRSALQQGNYGTAVAAFRQAVALEPTNGTYHEKLGLALMSSGSDGDATAELTEATRRGSAMAWIYLGDIAARQGDNAGAVGYYREYLERDPGNTSVQQKIDNLTR